MNHIETVLRNKEYHPNTADHCDEGDTCGEGCSPVHC